MLFAGPFEDDIDWKLIATDPNKRPGVHQWLGRVFAAVGDAVASSAEEPETLVRLTHKTIKGVTEDVERFRLNTAISKLMVLTNEMRTTLDAGGGARSAAAALTWPCCASISGGMASRRTWADAITSLPTFSGCCTAVQKATPPPKE